MQEGVEEGLNDFAAFQPLSVHLVVLVPKNLSLSSLPLPLSTEHHDRHGMCVAM